MRKKLLKSHRWLKKRQFLNDVRSEMCTAPIKICWTTRNKRKCVELLLNSASATRVRFEVEKTMENFFWIVQKRSQISQNSQKCVENALKLRERKLMKFFKVVVAAREFIQTRKTNDACNNKKKGGQFLTRRKQKFRKYSWSNHLKSRGRKPDELYSERRSFIEIYTKRLIRREKTHENDVRIRKQNFRTYSLHWSTQKNSRGAKKSLEPKNFSKTQRIG